MAQARPEQKKEIVAITFEVFISLVLVHMLEMPATKFPDLNLILANASVTVHFFNHEKASQAYFNNYSHLPPGLLRFG